MVLDGRKVKSIILDEVRNEVNSLNIKLKLVIIQIGDNESSDIYIKQKINMCNYVGYNYECIKLDSDVDIDSVLELINNLNNDDLVTGIIVQLPLPSLMDTDRVINAISPLKDVDCITDYNIIKLLNNKNDLAPCTPSGIMELLDYYNVSVSGKNVVILGRSRIVGKPLSMMMLSRDATVTVCHSKTKNLCDITKGADILVSAIGKAKYISSNMVKRDSIVIDAGISYLGDKLFGDIDYETVFDKVKYITPVPGGVGPMTVAMVAKNLLKCYKLQKERN